MRSPLTAIALIALASSFAMAQNGAITFSPSPLVFCTEPGQAISEVPVFISTSSGTAQFTSASVTSDGGWLTVTPTSGTITTTSHVLFFAAIKGGIVTLPFGTYSGQIVLSGSGGVVGKLDASLIVSGSPCGGTGSGLIAASPGALAFQIQPGVTFASQSVLLYNNFPTALAGGIDAITSIGGDWLSVFSSLYMVSHVSTPMFISVSSAGLQQGQTYSGTVELTASNGVTLNIPVTLNLTSSAAKVDPLASPAAIILNLPLASPGVTQKIQITNPSSFPINILTGTGVFNGTNWLSVSPSAVFIPANSTVTLSASITTGGLVTGVNGGAVGVSVASGTGGTVNIPVTVNYGGAAGSPLVVAPTQLSFTSQTGATPPSAQNLSLTSSAPASFSALVSTSSGGNWLSASPLTGSTPATIKVQVNPSGLTARTYSGQILITNTSTGEQQAIAVSFQISDLPVLTPSNSGATFTARTGSSIIPIQQSVVVASSASEFAFTASVTPVSGGSFLFVTPSSGATPQTLTLSLNPSVVTQLAANTYVANVTLTAAGAGNSPVIYPVTLKVINSTLLNPSQNSLNFNYQTGQAQAPAQFIAIGSTDASLNYAATVSTSNCSGFLSAAATSGNTPDTLAVSVNAAGLPVGTCNGTISLTSAAAGNSPLNIPVTLNIGNSAALNVSPGAIQVTAQVGTNAGAQAMLLSSTDGTTPLSFTATAATDTSQGWLSAGPASGNTPNSVNVTFNTAGLPIGAYLGRIVITTSGGKPVTVPVYVQITAASTISTNTSSLTFSQASLGPAPATQTLQVTSTVAGTGFTASAAASNGGTWLTVGNPTGSTPGAVTVSVNGAALSPGTYTGIVTIKGGSTVNVLVTLTVGPASILTVSTAALTFNYQAGGTLPQTQAIQVNSTAGFIPFTAATTGNFLTLTPSSGVTPGTVSVGLNASALASMSAGQYSGAVTISSVNAPGGSQKVNVTLVIAPSPAGTLAAVVNAASLKPGPVAPGELVTFFGSALGPQDGASFALTPQGTVPTTLANITVSFDGNLAPLTFVNATQINAIVPYEMAGRAGANVVVSRAGVSSAPFAVKVADTMPAIFSLNQTGNGQGAILNQNNTVNGPGSPASTRSVIQIFATGEGLCQGVTTGSFTPALPPFPKPLGSVSVTIGGKPAQILYAGEAPGAIAGLLQVNAMVPDGLGSGPQTVVLKVGENSNDSQAIVVTVQ